MMQVTQSQHEYFVVGVSGGRTVCVMLDEAAGQRVQAALSAVSMGAKVQVWPVTQQAVPEAFSQVYQAYFQGSGGGVQARGMACNEPVQVAQKVGTAPELMTRATSSPNALCNAVFAVVRNEKPRAATSKDNSSMSGYEVVMLGEPGKVARAEVDFWRSSDEGEDLRAQALVVRMGWWCCWLVVVGAAHRVCLSCMLICEMADCIVSYDWCMLAVRSGARWRGGGRRGPARE